MARKAFGKTPRNAPPPQREEFDFTVQRDGVDETHTFTAVITLDFVGMVRMMFQSKTQPEMAGNGMLTMVSKMLLNDDGVPNKWVPTQHRPDRAGEAPAAPTAHSYPPPPPAYYGDQPPLRGDVVMPSWPEGEGEVDPTLPAVFRAPWGPEKGQLLPFDRASEFEALEVGSSRRRWRLICLDDDEVTIQSDAIRELFEWLLGLAAGRPTR